MQKIVSAVSNQIQQLANPTVTKRYKLEGTIGKGNFSQVKRATDRQTGQEVAVKVLSLATLKDKEKVRPCLLPSTCLSGSEGVCRPWCKLIGRSIS